MFSYMLAGVFDAGLVLFMAWVIRAIWRGTFSVRVLSSDEVAVVTEIPPDVRKQRDAPC